MKRKKRGKEIGFGGFCGITEEETVLWLSPSSTDTIKFSQVFLESRAIGRNHLINGTPKENCASQNFKLFWRMKQSFSFKFNHAEYY